MNRFSRHITIASIIAVAFFYIERRELGHLLRHFGL